MESKNHNFMRYLLNGGRQESPIVFVCKVQYDLASVSIPIGGGWHETEGSLVGTTQDARQSSEEWKNMNER